jgi:hypothetical protein
MTTGIYGELGAKLNQHMEWQRDALRQSEVQRSLRTSGAPASHEPLTGGRLSAAIGGALVRLGTRLQGNPRPASNPAR